jgi:mono/diheme cytochrome c family protein
LALCSLRRVALPALALLPLLGGCKPLDDTLAAVPIFRFMRSSPALGPYEAPRPAPPGAVPFASPNGPILPPIPANEGALTAFGATAENPFPMSAEVIEAGRVLYDRHCAACHGANGNGQGPVVGNGGWPPLVNNLTAPQAVQRTDGYIYAIIRVGRGLMMAYGSRITDNERWQIVNYVRYLQQQAGVALSQPLEGPGSISELAAGAAQADPAAGTAIAQTDVPAGPAARAAGGRGD